MLQRTASVNNVKINSLGISSIFQIGDSHRIQAFSRALAVQREAQLFFDNEGSLTPYPIFSEPIPLIPITENVKVSQQNLNPFLKVGNINIIGVSSSAVVHLGNTRHISMEARIKHIRQLHRNKEQT